MVSFLIGILIWLTFSASLSSLLTLGPITESGYFRLKADIKFVISGEIFAEISNIVSETRFYFTSCFEKCVVISAL